MVPVICRAGFVLAASAIAAWGPLLAAAKAAVCKDYTKQYEDHDDQKKNGATDKDGDGCKFYASHSDECGKHDVEDFIAEEMCCSCGGGSTSAKSRSIAVNKASVLLAPAGEECPAGLEPITTFTGCRAALDMISLDGSNFQSEESEEDWPKGCYYCGEGNCDNPGVWFNKEGGKSKEGSQLICQKDYDPASVKILFVGDSDIDYWDSGPAFPGSFNVGIGGYTTGDVIKEVDSWVEDVDAEWVVIVCGENDISGDRGDTKKALKRFKKIVRKFIADGSRVIYMGTKPEPGSKDIYKEYKYYDKNVRQFARTLANDDVEASPPLQMVDVFLSFTSAKKLYNSDDLHMSRLGYKFWNEWVKLAMNSKDPCIRWRDGVCMESTGDPKPAADRMRKFEVWRVPMAEVGIGKLSGAFLVVMFVGAAAAVVVWRSRGRAASVLPHYVETSLLEADQ